VHHRRRIVGALAEELNTWLVTTDRALLAAIPERAVTPKAFLASR
jgi:predicted nucleic acid-binding protein